MFLEIPKVLFNANFNLKRNKQNKIKNNKNPIQYEIHIQKKTMEGNASLKLHWKDNASC